MDDLQLTIHQTAPRLGDLAGNEEEIRARAAQSASSDLVVFPELALTGYNLRNRVQRVAFSLSNEAPLGLPSGLPPVLLGLPERGEDELVYNSALLIHHHRILAKHRKVYLPTYGPFDEGRYFAPGRDAPPVTTIPPGWRVGILICEDFWHPALHYLLAVQGAHVVVVLSAAPGRGSPDEPSHTQAEAENPAPAPALFSSPERWVLLARAAALQYGVFVVLANRAGVEEGVTFAGGSVVVSPEGRVLARAPQGDPAALGCTLPREQLRQARTPYAHLRDEDPGYLWRALGRLQGQA
jgi:predicted amidohydrolase